MLYYSSKQPIHIGDIVFFDDSNLRYLVTRINSCVKNIFRIELQLLSSDDINLKPKIIISFDAQLETFSCPDMRFETFSCLEKSNSRLFYLNSTKDVRVGDRVLVWDINSPSFSRGIVSGFLSRENVFHHFWENGDSVIFSLKNEIIDIDPYYNDGGISGIGETVNFVSRGKLDSNQFA